MEAGIVRVSFCPDCGFRFYSAATRKVRWAPRCIDCIIKSALNGREPTSREEAYHLQIQVKWRAEQEAFARVAGAVQAQEEESLERNRGVVSDDPDDCPF